MKPPVGVERAADSRPFRLAIFRVDFRRDGAGALSTGNGRFDLRRGVTGVPVDPPPHDRVYFEAHGEALRRFYDAQSYGSLQVAATVFPAEPDSAFHLLDTADYGPWEVSQNPDVIGLAERFVGDAIAAVDADPENVNFADFDAFVVMHAGADFQGDVGRNTPFDIPSFTISLGESIAVNGGASQIGRVLVLPETASQDDRIAALNGVFAHEFGHILDLVDLYNIYNGVPQVGYWSLMDSGENISAIVVDPVTGDEFLADGIFPTSLDPWSKLQIFPETVLPRVVEERWEGALQAIERGPGFPLVVLDGLEYFLVENRATDLDGNGFPFVQQDSTTGVFLGPVDDPGNPGAGGRLEYDAVLPGGGILIWHIDDRLAVPGFQSGAVNFRTGERGVAVEEADGIADQGRFNFGTLFDPFFVGNNPRFAPGTIPGSEAIDGAYSGITIETSSPPGPNMNVQIVRDLALDGWPLAFAQSEEVRRRVGSLTLADLSGDGVPEVVFGLDATVDGIPVPLRTLVQIGLDGVPYGDTVFVNLPARLLPGIAASDSFVTALGEPAATVVAGTVNTGQVFLWDKNGEDLLRGRGRVNAATAPVLWPAAGSPGAVLTAGVGTFQVLHPSGVGDRTDSSRAAPGAFPSAGPTVLPASPGAGGSGSDLAAVAFEGGVVEFFAPGPEVPASVPAPFVLSATARTLLSGWVSPDDTGPVLVAVTSDSVSVLSPWAGTTRAAWALPLGLALPPVLGDLDGDARSEIAAVDTGGRVLVWNGDGSPALGWPRSVVPPVRDLKIADLDADGNADLLVLDGAGRFHGWSGRGEMLPGYPRALGPYDVVDAVVERFDRRGSLPAGAPPVEILWLASTDQAALLAVEIGKNADPVPGGVGEWRYSAGGRGRGHHQAAPSANSPATDAPVLEDPLFVYPNPARDWVEMRFLLDDGESAALEILDVSGRVIDDARLDRRGGFRAGENAVRWDLTGTPPGLFLCRLERMGPGGSRVDFARLVVIR
jgi:M6 family metalloprotease-like protein